MPLTDSVVDSTFGRLSDAILAPLEASRRSALARIEDEGRFRTQITFVWPFTGRASARASGAAREEVGRRGERTSGSGQLDARRERWAVSSDGWD